MAYEDIYKGLTEEKKERLIKADIPKFRSIGKANLSKKELEQGKRDLHRLIREFENGEDEDNN